MQFEDYFYFFEDEIRLKGHRIWIDDVVNYYHQGYSPEQIASEFPGLKLEVLYATIAYYLHNQAQIDAYITQLKAWRERQYQTARTNSMMHRLRERVQRSP
ncbi:hypothetical protein PN36_15735 [Candidatus Thiomargarita nelsonii]|uniref:Protein containing DUF433 n=1 Tax=Candidatus Thiomargarita nelsonii TaxID=1003181 RepID=A0A4E0RI04_9GAMM|nr:hypothetical protein PN36_15735 [Candidatus Thiomargarita nelsonii]